MELCKIFSIEGNIGSGKSTLVKILKEHYNDHDVVFLDEPVDVWQTIKYENWESYFSKFYADHDKYSFSFQLMAYVSRIAKLREILKSHP